MQAARQNRAQLIEAIFFFSDSDVVAEMLYPEFEAILDQVVSMPERADQQVKAAYVVINPRLQVRAAVFFYLDFDEHGAVDSGWNIPLRQLTEKSGHGPDLGAGPIRLVCRSQTPVDWLQMHLWDPELAPERNHLLMVRDAVKRNNLRLVVDELQESPVVEVKRLQMAAEDSWQTPQQTTQERAEIDSAAQAQRDKAAQMIKQQRLRIRALENQHNEVLTRLRAQAEHGVAQREQHITELKKQLQDQLEAYQLLRDQYSEQVQAAKQAGREAQQRVRELTDKGHDEIIAQQEGLEEQLQACEAAVAMEYQKTINVHKAQLAERDLQLLHAQDVAKRQEEELEYLKTALEDQILQRLQDAGVSLVTMQPGAGHMTIPIDEVEEFLASPAGYSAKVCMVSKENYLTWLTHYVNPACDAVIEVTGEKCGLPLERKSHPSRFTAGVSNRCSRHKELW